MSKIQQQAKCTAVDVDEAIPETNADYVHVKEDVEQEQAKTITNRPPITGTVPNTPYSSTTVYIAGMPIRYCTETVIEKLMSRYGKIVRCTTVHTSNQQQQQQGNRGTNKVFAFCEYVESSSATESIRTLNGRKLGGKFLTLRPAFKESNSSSRNAAVTTAATAAATAASTNNPKRQRQQLDSKIEAIKRKLAKHSNHSNDNITRK